MIEDAVTTAEAEQHLKGVAEGFSDAQQAVAAPAKPQEFVETVVRIVRTKTKRVKQHSRRAKARAAKDPQEVQHKWLKWPKELIENAEDFKNWGQDVFMHVAVIVMSEHLQAQEFEVRMTDGITDMYRRHDIKNLIECHKDVLGVHEYGIPESKESARVAKAIDSWDEFYDNLDYWLQKDSHGNYTRVCAL